MRLTRQLIIIIMELLQQMETVVGKTIYAHSLASTAKDKKLYRTFRRFICGLTPWQDNRDGALSWLRLLQHSKDHLRNALCFNEHIYLYEGARPIFLSTVFVASDQLFLGSWRGISGLWLRDFLINRDFRGQGLGRLALQRTEEELRKRMKEQGTQSVRLNLFTHNPHALNLYQKCRYVPFGKLGRKRVLLSKQVHAS